MKTTCNNSKCKNIDVKAPIYLHPSPIAELPLISRELFFFRDGLNALVIVEDIQGSLHHIVVILPASLLLQCHLVAARKLTHQIIDSNPYLLALPKFSWDCPNQ